MLLGTQKNASGAPWDDYSDRAGQMTCGGNQCPDIMPPGPARWPIIVTHCQSDQIRSDPHSKLKFI